MSDLATQQQKLLAALFDWPCTGAMKTIAEEAGNTSTRGLKAYQTNGHMLAERSLAAAYPVVAQLLGEESLADLARALWHAYPPHCGDLALWGAALPDYLERSPQLADDPYLADVARVEWALHASATAVDADADPVSLALLTTEDPSILQLRLAPGCFTLASAWPVASILGAHINGTPTFAEVGAQLRAGVPQDTLVWRRSLRPEFREALAGEAGFVMQLCAGQTLGAALDANHALDFAQWFPLAIQSKLVLGAFIPPAVPDTSATSVATTASTGIT
jgi:hypothetical protein